MLTDLIKNQIQKAYRDYLTSSQLHARRGQREMIAHIARRLTLAQSNSEQPPFAIVEAGTGTGKTLAYLLPSLIIAKASSKQVILATATVTLQQQLLGKDIPAIQQHTDLTFSVVQGKGRARYYCPMAAEQAALQLQTEASLFQSDQLRVKATQSVLTQLHDDFNQQHWDGDLDQLTTALTPEQRQAVTISRSECLGAVCPYFDGCPYYLQRAAWQDADLIVVNHDLVLSDLLLGGGVILPTPEQVLYIFDEAHHLPDKSLQHFQQRFSLAELQRTAESLPRVLQKGLTDIDANGLFASVLSELGLQSAELTRTLSPLLSLLSELPMEQQQERSVRYRFKNAEIPEALKVSLLNIKPAMLACHKLLIQVQQWLTQQWRDQTFKSPAAATLTQTLSRIEHLLAEAQTVCDAYCGAHPGEEAAFWFEFEHHSDQGELCCSPFFSRQALQRHLFARAWAVVMTSATLSVAGQFNRFMDHTGLWDPEVYCRVSGAFDYAEQGELWVPKDAVSGADVQAHTYDLIRRLPDLCTEFQATLVLFSSRQQMEQVYAGLASTWQDCIQCQGEASREVILERHAKRLEQQQTSVIFGLDSYAEGVDLPGTTLTQVIIAKLPFRMPDDPVYAAAAESIERSGGQPFMQITLPDAIMKLTQAVGRLIRTRDDHGRVVILDGRIHTARYGQLIVSALPPFRLRY